MPVLEIIGWVGSALVVVSLMQARVLRFRVMNLAGSVIAAGYNAIVGIWPFAVMNAIIAVIDVYWLARLLRERHDAGAYDVVQVDAADQYLRHVVGVHAADIARYFPSFAVVGGPTVGPGPGQPSAAVPGGVVPGGAVSDSAVPSGAVPAGPAPVDQPTPAASRWAYLVLRGDETVGVVVVRDEGAGLGEIELDYVTPRFRDFTPGEFVYRRSGVFAGTGLRSLVFADDAREAGDYPERVGFRQVDGRWRRDVVAAAA